jgi:hypothetical protein
MTKINRNFLRRTLECFLKLIRIDENALCYSKRANVTGEELQVIVTVIVMVSGADSNPRHLRVLSILTID